MPILSKANPPAYYIGYTLTSMDHAEVMGSNGALLNSQETKSRWLERGCASAPTIWTIRTNRQRALPAADKFRPRRTRGR